MAKNSVKTNGNDTTVSPVANGDSKTEKSGSKSYYFNAANERTRSPKAESVGLGFEFTGQDNVELRLDAINNEILHLASLQGLNIKLQRSYNTAGKDMAVAHDECEAARDNLAEGNWLGDREKGGLRISDLVEAIVRQMTVEGQDGESKRATIKAKLADKTEAGEKLRTKYRDNKDIKTQLAVIEGEKLAAKTAAIAALPSTGETIGDDFA